MGQVNKETQSSRRYSKSYNSGIKPIYIFGQHYDVKQSFKIFLKGAEQGAEKLLKLFLLFFIQRVCQLFINMVIPLL